MADVNEIRIHDLIDRFFNCDLEGEDRAALERSLLRSPRARELFWSKADVHEGLREWGVAHWDRIHGAAGGAGCPVAPAMEAGSWAAGWGRAVRAAAIPMAVLLGTVLGAGVAWAVAPQVRQGVTLAIRLASGGFEEAAGLPPPTDVSVTRLESLPTRFGEWGGDAVRVCGPEHGITPVEGSRMLAFERALMGPGSMTDSTARSCGLFQLVDLSRYQRQIEQGGCTIALAAKLLDGGGARAWPTDFIVRVHLFSGKPDDVLPGWPESRFDAVAASTERITSPGNEALGWREVVTQAIVPKGATFAIVHIDATSMDRTPGSTPAVFDRHYCDDVRLTLTVPPRPESPR